MSQKLIATAAIAAVFFSGACVARFAGTDREYRVPVGGYVIGAVVMAAGGIPAGASAAELVVDGVEYETIDHRVGLGLGGALLAIGAGLVVGSAVYHLNQRPDEAGKVHSYESERDPRWHSGQYAVERSSGALVYVYEVHPQHEWSQAAGRYVYRIYYWVCAHAGPSADCWWRVESGLKRAPR